MTCPRAGVETPGTTGLTRHVDRMDVPPASGTTPATPADRSSSSDSHNHETDVTRLRRSPALVVLVREDNAPRPDSMTAPTRPATMSFPDIVREARHVLPGARLRRRLFWRYTLVWHQR
jgi:hypothetical protein